MLGHMQVTIREILPIQLRFSVRGRVEQRLTVMMALSMPSTRAQVTDSVDSLMVPRTM